ncbi:MAG: hypothetical protein Q9228_007865, partial [Teloschistes exilis]
HVAFVARVLANAQDEPVMESRANEEFDWLVERVCTKFSLDNARKGIKQDHSGKDIFVGTTGPCLTDPLYVVLLLQQLACKAEWKHHGALLERVTHGIESMPPELFPTIFMPGLSGLSKYLRQSPDHVCHYKELFQELLEFYRIRYIRAMGFREIKES